MEGSESEEVFQSMNLNPQLFINEILNSVDDLVDDAFDFFHDEASIQLKTERSDKSGELEKGINCIRNKIKGVLNEKLSMWEKYCLRYCFSVPSDFVLPNANESSASSSRIVEETPTSDLQLDEELESLRNKLAGVGKETAELDQELQALEKQYAYSNSRAESVRELLQFYEQNSVQDMFEEMMGTAAELKSKMEELKNKENEGSLRERMYDANEGIPVVKFNNGLLKLEEMMGTARDL